MGSYYNVPTTIFYLLKGAGLHIIASHFRTYIRVQQMQRQMGYSLNSLKGGLYGDYIGNHYRGY